MPGDGERVRRGGSTEQWPGWSVREVYYSLLAVEASDFIGAGGPASRLFAFLPWLGFSTSFLGWGGPHALAPSWMWMWEHLVWRRSKGEDTSVHHTCFFLKYYTCFLRLFLFVYGTCVILLVGNKYKRVP